MTEKNHTEAGLLVTDAEMKAALANPDAFPEFLRRYRMTTKLQRIADDHHAQVHQEARMAIVAIKNAPNCNEVISALRKSTGIKKNGSLVALVLNQLIEYTEKDSSARSRDKGIQGYLAAHNIIAADTATKIKDLGGLQATYQAYRDENRKSAPPRKKRPPLLSKSAVLKACPKGGSLLVLLMVDKSGRAEIVQQRPMVAIGPSIWPAVAKAASDAEEAVTLH